MHATTAATLPAPLPATVAGTATPGLRALGHVTVRSADLARTERFYCDLLGLRVGPRPAIAVPGFWLYLGNQPLLHVLAQVPGTDLAARGVIDHFALDATGRAAFEARLRAAGQPFDSRRLADSGTWQVFIHDPDGARVELSFQEGAGPASTSTPTSTATSPPFATDGGHTMTPEDTEPRGCVVQGASSYTSQQGSVYAPGISAETAGSKAVFLGRVTIPPQGRTKAHLHARHESAFYLLSGDTVELCTGPRLEHRALAHAGDYLFIPANVPHVAVNRGDEPAVFIGVRNEPTAQESVVMLPELDGWVP